VGQGGMHDVSDLSHFESRFTTLDNMMKGLVPKQSQTPETLKVLSQCHAFEHTLSTYPTLLTNWPQAKNRWIWLTRDQRM